MRIAFGRERARGAIGGRIDRGNATRNRAQARKTRASAIESADGTRGGKNLIIIGARGCGKSSVCRRIAAFDKRFKTFVMDDLISYEEGMSIPAIVKEKGWRHFRDVEYAVAKKAASAFEGWTLIDAGGGGGGDLDEDGKEVYSERKVAALKANGGLVVFLDRDVEYLQSRVAGDENRPSLSATASFAEIMERRRPWYLRAADFVVDGGGANEGSERPLMKKKRIASSVLKWYYDAVGEQPPAERWFELDVEQTNE